MGRAMGLAGVLLGLLLVPAVLLSTSLGRGDPPPEPEPEPEVELELELGLDEGPLTAGAAEDSLWPLPQSLRTSRRQLQLAPDRFQLVHGAGSSAGPGCGILQDAFRRSAAAGRGPGGGGRSGGCGRPPEGVCVRRYYEYIFGQSRWWSPGRQWPSLRRELSQLQVVITAPEPGCDSYPRLASSEACEYPAGSRLPRGAVCWAAAPTQLSACLGFTVCDIRGLVGV